MSNPHQDEPREHHTYIVVVNYALLCIVIALIPWNPCFDISAWLAAIVPPSMVVGMGVSAPMIFLFGMLAVIASSCWIMGCISEGGSAGVDEDSSPLPWLFLILLVGIIFIEAAYFIDAALYSFPNEWT